MFVSQWPFVELDRSLHEYRGDDAYTDLLEGWLENNSDEVRWIADYQHRTQDDWFTATGEDLCRLYALFRVTSTLMLRFQSGRADGTDYQGPAISIEGFQLFHEQLGFCVPNIAAYHPFFHEILAVTPTSDEDSPIQVTEIAWPCLMLGDMLFCRAGCAVTGGKSSVVKDIAESSKLYWTFRRKDRPCDDRSHGWGTNSQWRTAHRRDYRTARRYHFNVDGRHSLNDLDCVVDDVPMDTMIELVRNRCLVRTCADDSDLYPYEYTYAEDAEPSSERKPPLTSDLKP